MNILILDDKTEETTRLSRLLRGLGVEPIVFHDGRDALDYVRGGARVDVCFLDIVMPKISGIQTARELRSFGYTDAIVFLSSSKEYGPESYQVKAFDYLIKPPSSESVKGVLEKIENARKNADTAGITVKTKSATRFIRYSDISHIEAVKHFVCFRLMDKNTVEVYAAFGEYADALLTDARFIRCHRSYIVNMDEISEIAASYILMRTGARIPVSRSFANVKHTYFNRIFGRAEI